MKECHSYNDKYGNSGLTCDGVLGNCLTYSEWFNDKYVASCSHLGGLTSLHQEVCGNHTYWHPKTCRQNDEDGVRCSSAWSGQCYFLDTTDWWLKKTCDDGSDEIHPRGSK